jgi:hypothetical protein
MSKKNAIVVLTRGYTDVRFYTSLINRNIFIYKNIISKTGDIFDFIIFHEGNISESDKKFINDQTPNLNIIFSDLRYTGNKKAFNSLPKTENNPMCPSTRLSNSFPIGYKHMCHFWSLDFLNYLKDYKYIIRVDEDCFINEYDVSILDQMEKNNTIFSCPFFQEQDVDEVILGLETLRNDFCEKNSIRINTKFSDIRCPYTNVMIVDIENICKNQTIINFLNEIDNSGCIYFNRWGDLPIWGVILDTFLTESSYKEEKGIKYFHGSHNKPINL